MTDLEKLIAVVREMASKCHLQNSEQISEVNGAIGAVRMIQYEYIDTREAYLNILRKVDL